MSGKCFICRPVVCSIGGGDHVGEDFFLRCPKCRTRTECHVEGYSPTPEIAKILRKEWRAGRIASPPQSGTRP